MSARGRTRLDVARMPATAGEIAWVAALPVALLALAAIVLLGPPLGDALFAPGSARFWPAARARPEPTEHARYVLALLGPLLLSGAVAVAQRRGLASRPGLRAAALAAQWLLLAFVVFAVLSPRFLTYRGAIGALLTESEQRVYFTAATLAVAVAIVGAAVAALRSPTVVERVRAASRDESRGVRLALLGLAALYVAIWMLTSFNTEGSIGRADAAVLDSIPFWLNETYAVLDGLHPLTSFHAQYANLWPYATAGAMALLGTSFGVYSGVMVAGTTAAMLAVYATFRRVVHSSLLALALFVPFVATSFFKELGTYENRYGPSNLWSLFPIRFGGPFVLAWLLSRQLDGRAPRSRWALFLFAGVVAFNNPELGAPAFAATLAALAWTLPQPDWRSLGRLAGAAALGALGALAGVGLFTLVVAGELPRLGLLVEFSRIYGAEGFGMLPMPAVGLHLAIYVTFAGALVLASVRALTRQEDRLLTGLLCWIAVFGFGAGGYYAGRSHPEVLIDVFSPWAFALALLLVASVRAIVRRPRRLPAPAELAVLAGCALAICSIAQTPLPWSQLDRLSHPTATPRFRLPGVERFVASRTRPGERVVIMIPLGNQIAYDVGVRNAFPYAHVGSMPAVEQWEGVDRLMREQRIRTLYVPVLRTHELLDAIVAAGFRLTANDEGGSFLELTR